MLYDKIPFSHLNSPDNEHQIFLDAKVGPYENTGILTSLELQWTANDRDLQSRTDKAYEDRLHFKKKKIKK